MRPNRPDRPVSIQEVVAYLKDKKDFFYDEFGVTRIGIFGSFVRDEQTRSSDIDVVVEIEKNRKNIHTFMRLKRFLEKELSRGIDLGFEHSLKPIVREKIKRQVIYV